MVTVKRKIANWKAPRHNYVQGKIFQRMQKNLGERLQYCVKNVTVTQWLGRIVLIQTGLKDCEQLSTNNTPTIILEVDDGIIATRGLCISGVSIITS